MCPVEQIRALGGIRLSRSRIWPGNLPASWKRLRRAAPLARMTVALRGLAFLRVGLPVARIPIDCYASRELFIALGLGPRCGVPVFQGGAAVLETEPTFHASSSEARPDDREADGEVAGAGKHRPGNSGVELSRRELLTADELAQAFKVSKAAVRAWQRQGVPFVPIGRLRRRAEVQPVNSSLRAAR